MKRDYWCRDCNHLVDVFSNYKCRDCGSENTGLAPDGTLILSRDRNSNLGKTHEPQHDAMRQTQYPVTYRLARGFAIMNGGQV